VGTGGEATATASTGAIAIVRSVSEANEGPVSIGRPGGVGTLRSLRHAMIATPSSPASLLTFAPIPRSRASAAETKSPSPESKCALITTVPIYILIFEILVEDL